MLDDETIEGLNQGYVCPPEAGPAWRAACEYGLDMSLVEEALEMTPERRLEEHQHALNLLLEIEASRDRNASKMTAAKEAVGRERDREAVRYLRGIKERNGPQGEKKP